MINRMLLRKLREAKGLSQTALAARAKVTQAYLAELESGRKARPTVEVLLRIAKALETDITALLGKGVKR
jgi:transcriptional regulator with XRE-family HTH domain